MIRQKIMAHEEPNPVVTVYSYPKTYTQMGEAERLEFRGKVQFALLKATCMFSIGDKIQLQSSKTPMVITGFIEDPATVLTYQGNLCVIEAISPNWHQTTKPLRYCIEEFDLNTLEKIEGIKNEQC